MYDVAVIGAGPAGTSAAYHLEKAGLNILILDKEDFPRPKACAGVIPPRIFSELSVPEDVVERQLEGYKIHSPSGMVVESKFPKPGIIVKREKFDDFLLGRLDGKPKRMNVLGCKSEKGHMAIRGKDGVIEAKYAVGAYGSSTPLDLIPPGTGKDPEISRNMALGCQFELTMDNDILDERIGNWFEVYYTILFGYGWISPLKNTVKVGVGGISDDIRKNGKRILEDFIEYGPVKEKLEGAEIIRFEAHKIPMGGPYTNLVSDRLILCGDAGGFVFPGTGEGIYYAIKSGRIAAEVITLALEEDQYDPRNIEDHYERLLVSNGLISLRDMDFINEVLSSEEGANKYVKRLKILSHRTSGPENL
jgi:geranylgeranyl reductase family protein